MRIKITLLATLFTLLIGFQTVRAQDKRATTVKGTKIENTSPYALAPPPQVQGTITVASSSDKRLSALKCSNIEVQIGKNENQKGGGLQFTIFKVVASGKATGDISTGKCSYSIRNPSGLAVNTYTIRFATNTNAACPYAIDVSSNDDKSIEFPTGDKVVTRDFKVTPSCN